MGSYNKPGGQIELLVLIGDEIPDDMGDVLDTGPVLVLLPCILLLPCVPLPEVELTVWANAHG